MALILRPHQKHFLFSWGIDGPSEKTFQWTVPPCIVVVKSPNPWRMDLGILRQTHNRQPILTLSPMMCFLSSALPVESVRRTMWSGSPLLVARVDSTRSAVTSQKDEPCLHSHRWISNWKNEMGVGWRIFFFGVGKLQQYDLSFHFKRHH